MIKVQKGDRVHYFVKTAGVHEPKEGYVDRVYRPMFGRRMVAIVQKDSALVDVVPNSFITEKIT